MSITEPWATRPRDRPTYLLSRWLFLRLLGVIYLIAFVSLVGQMRGLVGEHGILPARAFLDGAHALYGGRAYRLFPTLCWLGAGDGTLEALCWAGAALALLLVAGVAQAPTLALLWVCYLSLSVVGQTFLWFQWDALLLETGLLAILYAPTQLLPSLARERAPSRAMRWLVWWLLFRLMFLSGITKLASGDPTWRNLTALDYHFWTQPLPTWTAWYAQWLPEWTHRGMLLTVLVIELVVPWLILVPERLARLRLAAGALLVLGQLGIAGTGNYGFFNALAIVLCVPLLDDATLRRVLPLTLEAGDAEPRWKQLTIRVVAPAIAVLSTLAFAREIAQTLPGARGGEGGRAWLDNPLLAAVAPFRSINGYGLFRVMTTERPEIVIEGSSDSLRWREYRFRWKPGDVTRRPRFVAPHQPRLDWQMWFAALDPEGARQWLGSLLGHLLRGTPEVLSLLGENPFPDGPPKYVRLAYYRYRFATPAERARTGAWWARELAGYLTGPLSLTGPRPTR
ncbi:MAG TPA: lipase maturation factor family protein [Gemmatimonadales bacterium]|nr:lipase maturation factor family protein [Gemmatimonadales bacterium]